MSVPGQAPPVDPARYRLERELGRGGMAVVYLAHDLKHGRPVAIKVVRPEIVYGFEWVVGRDRGLVPRLCQRCGGSG